MTLTEIQHIWKDELDISTKDVAVYTDKYPVTLGHLLFVPRVNTNELITQAFALALDYGQQLLVNKFCEGFNIGINCNSAAGQTIMYPHVHLIPRRTGDCDDPIGGVRRCVDGQGNYRISSYINPISTKNTNLINGMILPEFLHLYEDIVPDIDQSSDVPGLIDQADLDAIATIASNLPDQSNIIEIGSFLGKSAVEWAKTSSEVYCIDYFQMPIEAINKKLNNPISGAITQFDIFKHYTKNYPNIHPIIKKFDTKFDLQFKNVGCVFDDSDHTEKTLELVFNYWWNKLLPNGFICGDDYNLPQVFTTVNKYATLFQLAVKTYPNSKIWAIQKLK